MTTLARVEHVTRRFGDVTALDDISLEIGSGRIVGLLGPNGAGKTTLLSLLQGQRKPTSGTVELFGGDPRDHRTRTALGSTAQETALPPTLKVGEVVDFVGKHYADPVPTDELADEFGFGDLLRRQTGALSGGQKRRVSVALAFVGRPRLVLLDEPTTGLDVDARRALWDAVRRQHEQGATVVVTSHYLEEIEALAERVIVFGQGRVLADDSLAAVLGQVGVRRISLVADPAALEGLPGVVSVTAEAGLDTSPRNYSTGGRLTVLSNDGDATVTALVRSGIPFSDLAVRGATLEEAFLTLTQDHAQEVSA